MDELAVLQVQTSQEEQAVAVPAVQSQQDVSAQTRQERVSGAVATYCQNTADNCREYYEDLNIKVFFITYFICFVLTFGFTIMMQGGLGISIYIYRGFDLNDHSLSFPHMPSRISGNANILASLAITIMIFAMKVGSEPDGDNKGSQEIKTNSLTLLTMLKSLVNLKLLFDIFIMIYGCIVNNFMTNMIKSFSGVLKPHFIAECSLNDTIVNQLEVEGVTYVNESMTRLICTNQGFADYRRSFPSGHVTQVTYAMTMSILAIQTMKVKPEYYSLKLLGQLICTLYASFIAFDRIKDHHHSWMDVLGGISLGVAVALFVWFGYITALKTKASCIDKSRRKVLAELQDISEEIQPFVDEDKKIPRVQTISAC